jgi:hypothetical protein
VTKPTTVARLTLGIVAAASLALGAVPPASATTSTAPAAPTAEDAAKKPNPLKLGPNDVVATEYNFGDTAFQPPGFPGPVEMRASVHYPKGLKDGPYPLVMLMHGRHSTCYQGSQSAGGWPCAAGYESIPSFAGYDYLAENLASWGYIVASVSANGINARDSSSGDAGMTARGQLMQEHLHTWEEFSTDGADPFGDLFVGKVDMQNIGTMGHSRGGEGVVRHYIINEDEGSPYGIQAVLPLAPVDFFRPVINNVPMSVILPYCDGDVSDLQGIHFYDDSRYNVANDKAPKYAQEVIGANHNHFNTVWTPGEFPAGTWNDTTCSSFQLTAAQQRDVGEAYMATFFRIHLGGETKFERYFDGRDLTPKAVKFADIHQSYHAPANQRVDVNRFLDDEALEENQLGGDVKEQKLSPFDLCGGPSPQPQHCLPLSGQQQPHTTGDRPGLSQLRYGWESKKAQMINEVPGADGNVSKYQTLTFRTGRNFADPRTPAGKALDFSVVLTDGSGKKSSVRVAKWSDALFAQPGSGSGLPKMMLSTVRIPLDEFKGVDLTDVSKITFKHDKSKSGAILSTDLAFTGKA